MLERIANNYSQKVLRTSSRNLLGYWPMSELTGSVAYDLSGRGNHGAYTGCTLGQPGIGDGLAAPFFDGANDFLDILSSDIQATFNEELGSMMVWAKPFNAGVWTDGQWRGSIVVYQGFDDFVNMRKGSLNGEFYFRHQAETIPEDVILSAQAWVGWKLFGMSWNKAGDGMKAFLSGVQQGPSQAMAGLWDGSLTGAIVGSNFSLGNPLQFWHGWLGHAAIWGAELSQSDFTNLGRV